jgi:outer membrane protein assembly factor BamA
MRVFVEGEVVKPLRKYHERVFEVDRWTEVTEALDQWFIAAGHTACDTTVLLRPDTITVRYRPGPVYQWGRLEIDDEARWVLGKAGVRYRRLQRKHIHPRSLLRAYEKVLVYYENHGFPFASIGLDSVTIAEDRVYARLKIQAGRLVRIDSVVIEGDLKMRETYLTNYLGIREGSLYDERAIKQVPNKLNAVRFLRQIRPPLVIFEEEFTKVKLFLNKQNASSFDGIIGFLPGTEEEGLLITGDVKLHLENALKQGEIFNLNWRKLQTNTQELTVEAVTPYVLNSGFSLDGNLKIYRRDTLFTDVFRQVGVRYGFGAEDYLRLFFDRQTTDLISTDQYALFTSVPPFLDRAINAYGIGVRIENLDYRMNPSKGMDLDVQAALGSKQIIQNQRLPESIYDGLTLRSNQYKGALSFAYFVSPIKRVVVHQLLLASGLANEQLFNNEAYRIGGLKTLRGFNEESIFATTYSILRTELRYQLDRDGYLFGFFDGAWYENTSRNRIGAARDTPFGFGVGMAFGTKAGNFSISYALGRQQKNPILLRTSKVHFGFVSLF